jgi:predicted N-acetyltransferase YhbS
MDGSGHRFYVGRDASDGGAMTSEVLNSTGARVEVALRAAQPEDAQACGRICYQAFRAVADAHGFPPDFPSVDVATGLVVMLIAHPGFYGVVADCDGEIVASNFLDERSVVAGVGPVTVDPGVQDRGIGRLLMRRVMERAEERGFAGVRLLQSAYHSRSLSLYASLGFAVRGVFACMQGPPISHTVPGYRVRPATSGDLDACSDVCVGVHGHDRASELRDAIGQGTARVVEHDGRVTGYATSIAFFGHAVGETTEDVKALVGAASAFEGPGILVPARASALFCWCLRAGLRVVSVYTLMSTGLYNEPAGAYLPSIYY